MSRFNYLIWGKILHFDEDYHSLGITDFFQITPLFVSVDLILPGVCREKKDFGSSKGADGSFGKNNWTIDLAIDTETTRYILLVYINIYVV